MRIVVLIDPQPARYIHTRYGPKPSKEHTDYMKNLRFWLKSYAGSFPDPTVPIAGIMSFYFKRLKTVKRTHHTVKPDVDNLSKTTMDALKPFKVKRALKQEGVIADDAQVTDLYLRKRYTLKSSKVVITLWAYEQKDEFEENYQIQGILKLLP